MAPSMSQLVVSQQLTDTQVSAVTRDDTGPSPKSSKMVQVHENAKRSRHVKTINKQQCSPDSLALFCCFWPPLLCTQSMTACTPSERVSSSLRCHTAQQDPAGHVGPKGMSAQKVRKPRRQGMIVTKDNQGPYRALPPRAPHTRPTV